MPGAHQCRGLISAGGSSVPGAHQCRGLISAGGSSVPGIISGFCSMKRLGVFLLRMLDGILVHRRLPPSMLSGCPQFAGSHLYTWVRRGTPRGRGRSRTLNLQVPSLTHQPLSHHVSYPAPGTIPQLMPTRNLVARA